jgi:valyl-tRNA synthetase
MTIELAKQYDAPEVERRWAERWIMNGCFDCKEEDSRPQFSIVIPPPNITGTLHMGHALTLTIQDILVRFKRMCGYNTLWLPGTDHAGIATQMVVERALQKDGTSRHIIGREAFIQKIWEWKHAHGDRINEQTKALGASVDWKRERFTMDEGLSRAVREVFVSLYEEGLIYRDLRLINWCPRCQTALSDLEVTLDSTAGKLWTIDYPVPGSDRKISVATTRPETMLGDTAVAVHPNDPRYKDLIGKAVVLPLTERKIPVVADGMLVDPEFGTGCVKVTPAHDFNDFETGRRHGLETISVIDLSGRMTEAAGKEFAGLDRFEARQRVLDALMGLGLLSKTEDYNVELSRCQRCSEIVEPLLSKQWFVRVKPLAEPAMQAVRDGRTTFVPAQWAKTYFDWMENIRDWCISRQLWWGHRIPAWHCACGEIVVSREAPAGCPKCHNKNLAQDSDVLDTWFSSALWPFSTLGWPEKTRLLKTFYPTSVMETGFDIIFFWVARMMMMGLKFMGDVPFKTVFLHAMVRDAKGQKMSKTKGNVIDPLEVSEKTSADALRFTLAVFAAQGRDIKLSIERVEGYRHFINKIWNAARFALMNLTDFDSSAPETPSCRTLYDRWILARTRAVLLEVQNSIEEYKLNEAAGTLYNFFWHELCDWYLELSKPIFAGQRGADVRMESQRVLVKVLDISLRLLHPFTPFITEEIWQILPLSKRDNPFLANARWPSAEQIPSDDEALREINWLISAVSGVRNIRGESNVPPGKLLQAHVLSNRPEVLSILEKHRATILHLARLEQLVLGSPDQRPSQSAVYVSGDFEVCVPLGGVVDFAAEINRLYKEKEKTELERQRSHGKLHNPNFCDRAPADVVSKEQAKLIEAEEKLEKINRALAQLEAWSKS